MTEMTDLEHADLVLQRALVIIKRLGVPDCVALDRITTFAAGAHVQNFGNNATATYFRAYADRIEEGVFDAVGARH